MIPLKLKLKNFLSYGPEIQTIDFAPYGLICFSGKNGHGKSALLDAITWAVWGQARKVSGAIKADAHLLRLGQTQMMVCLDFLCNGQTYRIKREYTKTYGKPKNDLEFGILNTKTDTIMPLTDKTIRATQEKIEQTLRLTFEAFANSAFLRQGQANEFSKKSPKERKEIFAQILGLQQYELVRKKAMDKAKDATNKRAAIAAFQEKIAAELQKKKIVEQELKTTAQQLTALQKKETALASQQKKLQTEKSSYAEQQKKMELLQFQDKQLEKKQQELNKQISKLSEQWKRVAEHQKRLPDPKTLAEQKTATQKTVAEFQKKQQEQIALKETLLAKKQELQTIEKKLHEQQMAVVQQKKLVLQKLQLEQEACKLKREEFQELLQTKEKELVTLQTEQKKQKEILAQTDNLEKKVTIQEQELTKGKEQYQQLIAHGNMVKQQVRELYNKQTLVATKDEPCCPLCEQNLSASRKRFLSTKFIKQNDHLTNQLEQLTITIAKTKTTLLKKHELLQKNKKQLLERTELLLHNKETEKKLKTHKKETTQLKKNLNTTEKTENSLLKKCTSAQKALDKQIADGPKLVRQNDAYKAQHKIVTTLEKKLQTLPYDIKKHEAAVKQLQELEQKIATYAQLREQIALQAERKKQIKQLQKTADQTKTEKKIIEKSLKTYAPLQEQKKKIEHQEKNLQTEKLSLVKEKETLLQHKGAYENQQKKLQELEQQHKSEQKKLQELNETIFDYHEIANATSKNGIQALLIENAIPEVEQEANRLLSKLTNNQAQIFIESLRDLQKGGTKETLDIKISDTAGIRPYELFSGGEAFRIDFALRIAISKLLARRAGTALQTLIIDEGFGSQDEEGLAHIMDAIHKIQDDFVKIIVVSHLTTMKDQFPIHFFVHKDAHGSRVDVVQLG